MADADIFVDQGKAAAPSQGDADIFRDVEPTPPPPAAAPVEPSFLEKAMQANKYLGIGVPGGVATTMAVEGMGALNQFMERAGYMTGGAVTDFAKSQSGKHSLVNPLGMDISPEAAAGLGFGANIATQALPTVMGGEVAKLAAPAFQNMGRGVMQSALRPPYESLKTGKAIPAIETMLKEGISVTQGGAAKLEGEIGRLGDEVRALIKSSPAEIRTGDVGKSLVDTYNKLLESANPQGSLESLRKAWGEFRAHPLIGGREEIPVQLAQKIKQGTNRQLGDAAYGMGLKPSGEQDSLKGIVRGLKDEIAGAVPGVGERNARMSELLNAHNLLERRVLMDPNKALLGLTPLGINPASWALFMLDRMPGAKSLLARGLYSGAEQIPANAARIGIGYNMMPPESERGALYDVFPR